MERACVELDIMDHPVLSHVNLVPSAKAVCGNVYARTLPNVILNPANVHVTMDGQESIVITNVHMDIMVSAVNRYVAVLLINNVIM